ncbi:MAG: TonB family protein [Candidatus Acidiferrales bacterium]
MGTFTTEVPTSAAGTKSKRGGTDSLENEAIGLDISVRIHGSQVTAVVLDTTEHVEPFEEDTSTMIVFPRGAIVKLRARVRTGHAVVLTHLATKQTALCRIIQVNSAANVSHYVKLEFVQPVPGFWGVHFPSDSSNVPAATHEEHATPSEELEKLDAPETPVQSVPTANVPPATQALPRVDAPPPATKPFVHEVAKETVKPAPATQAMPRVDAPPAAKPFVREVAKEIAKPAPAPPVSYGISEDPSTNELVPLTSVPPKRAPIAPKPQATIPAPAHPAASPSTEAPPIFDSLSTGEEIFGKEAAATMAQETAILKSDQKAAQAFVRSLDPTSLLAGEVPKRHTGVKVFLSVAAVALLAAGAVFYVRQYRGNARQSSNVTAPARIPQTSSAAPRITPAQTAAESPATPLPETQPPTGARPAAKHALVPAAAKQSTIVVTPTHDSAKNSAPESHPTISNGMANIYAGDLTARPQATQHNNVAVDAPLPSINSTPKDLAGGSPGAGLSSLVGGASANLPALPKPAAPTPVVRGGQVTAPRLIHAVQPTYPSLATSNRIEGDVQIEAVIDQTGKVTSTKVISGPALLRSAAMDAVRQQKYSPATLDGKPITMQYKVTIRFRLGQ